MWDGGEVDESGELVIEVSADPLGRVAYRNTAREYAGTVTLQGAKQGSAFRASWDAEGVWRQVEVGPPLGPIKASQTEGGLEVRVDIPGHETSSRPAAVGVVALFDSYHSPLVSRLLRRRPELLTEGGSVVALSLPETLTRMRFNPMELSREDAESLGARSATLRMTGLNVVGVDSQLVLDERLRIICIGIPSQSVRVHRVGEEQVCETLFPWRSR